MDPELIRILRSTGGGDGGGGGPGGTPPPAVIPPATGLPPAPVISPAPPAPAPPATLPAGMIAIPATQWQQIQADMARLTQAEQARADEQRRQQEEAARRTGNLQPVLDARQQELDATRTRAQQQQSRAENYAREAALGLALAQHPIVEGWPEELMRLWRDRFRVVEVGDTYQVLTPDGRTPAQFVAAELAQPRYLGILRHDGAPGGVGVGGTTARVGAAGVIDTTTPGGRAYAHYLQAQQAIENAGGGMIGS